MKYFLGLFVFLTTSMAPVPDQFVDRHVCKAQNDVSCIVETSLVCPPGYYDGCLSGETKKHQCVLSEEGPSCDLDMTINCPENFQDGCISGETEVHTCVAVQGVLCTEGESLSCPQGFEDSCQ